MSQTKLIVWNTQQHELALEIFFHRLSAVMNAIHRGNFWHKQGVGLENSVTSTLLDLKTNDDLLRF